MRLAFLPSFSVARDPAARRRFLPLLLTILAHVLLLLMLLYLSPQQVKLPGPVGRLMTFSVLPEAQQAAKAEQASASAARAHLSAAPAPAPEPKIKLPPVVTPPWVLTPGLEKFDVRQVPTEQPAPAEEQPTEASDAAAAGSGHSGKGVYGPVLGGGSPGGGGGETLYPAEWYREPTDAELSYYLPKTNRQSGWGEIACQTVERYHVDNCRELGDYPAGSGLARAVRQAAWQFLVLPPRVNGRPQVGAWVRIRIEYTQTIARVEK